MIQLWQSCFLNLIERLRYSQIKLDDFLAKNVSQRWNEITLQIWKKLKVEKEINFRAQKKSARHESDNDSAIFTAPEFSFSQTHAMPPRWIHSSGPVPAQASAAAVRLHRRRRRLCRMCHRKPTQRRPVRHSSTPWSRRWNSLLHWDSARSWIRPQEGFGR